MKIKDLYEILIGDVKKEIPEIIMVDDYIYFYNKEDNDYNESMERIWRQVVRDFMEIL